MTITSEFSQDKIFVLTGEDCQVVAAVSANSGYCDLTEKIETAIREHIDCTAVAFLENVALSDTAEKSIPCALSFEDPQFDFSDKFYLVPVPIY